MAMCTGQNVSQRSETNQHKIKILNCSSRQVSRWREVRATKLPGNSSVSPSLDGFEEKEIDHYGGASFIQHRLNCNFITSLTSGEWRPDGHMDSVNFYWSIFHLKYTFLKLMAATQPQNCQDDHIHGMSARFQHFFLLLLTFWWKGLRALKLIEFCNKIKRAKECH